ncbi:MAG: histidine kinase [Spirosomataceae bacterium]
MVRNREWQQFVWGVSLFVALFVNFPIIFLNIPRLEHSRLAQFDIFAQIIICLIYSVLLIRLIHQGLKSKLSLLTLWSQILLSFVVFTFVLSAVNILIIRLPIVIIPTVLMRGALIAVIAYFFSRYISENERKNEILLENEQLKHENLLVQLTSLKNQLNPHFLFNSLNTLSWLINEDKEKSQQYLQKLSQVLRYSLSMQEQPLVSLQEELSLVDSYIFLLQMRFGQNLKITRSIRQVERFRIPPLSIQLLIENAIKHNVISVANPLHIQIEINTESKTIKVSNSLQLKPNSEGPGIGLANLNQRFKLLANQEIDIEQSEDFIVTLPLIV